MYIYEDTTYYYSCKLCKFQILLKLLFTQIFYKKILFTLECTDYFGMNERLKTNKIVIGWKNEKRKENVGKCSACK